MKTLCDPSKTWLRSGWKMIPIVIGLLLGFGACKESTLYPNNGDGTRNPNNQAMTIPDSYGILWKLKSFEDLTTGDVEEVPGGQTYTLIFRAEGLSGDADCNSYGASYTLGTDNTISVGNIAATEVACGPNSMEAQYYSELEGAASYDLTATTLRLYNADKTRMLRFGTETKPIELLKLELVRLKGSAPYSLTNAVIHDDILSVTVSYSGGCKDHEFYLYGPLTLQTSDPSNVTAYLIHESNADACEALVTETRQFDLTPLKKRWQEVTGMTAGVIKLSLHDGFTGIVTTLDYGFGLIQSVDNRSGGPPLWLQDTIDAILSRPFGAPPATIWEYTYNGDDVYYRTYPCCDMFTDLYDENGKLLCHPDGGLTGVGDQTCTDFLSARQNRQLIWRDPR